MHMEIKRTANAGILLRLDGITVLLDGVCNEVSPYLKTPDRLRVELLETSVDVIAFTHAHDDHYDASFVSDYLKNTAGPVLGPADIPLCDQAPCRIGDVRITPVKTRHLGKTDPIGHVSYVIEGSACVWFMGDASPMMMSALQQVREPDVIVAPYAYATAGGWEITKKYAPKGLIVLHLPERENDPFDLWGQVEATVGNDCSVHVYTPAMGQKICFTQ